VAGNDLDSLRAMSDALNGMGYLVEAAQDGVQAVEKFRSELPDLVLLDVSLPKMNGLEVCRFIKLSSPDAFVPVVLVSSSGDVDSKVIGLNGGADDYLGKPFDMAELRARVTAMLRIKELQDRTLDRWHELESLSAIDDLTGLLNPRAMRQRLRAEFARSQRYNDPLAVMMVDVDHFKKVNDECGHLFGDHVLAELAGVLKSSCREIDAVARYGGDEFLLVLPQTHFAGSLTVGERIWRGVGAHTFAHAGTFRNVTVSIGISFYPHTTVDSPDGLVSVADRALYQAKSEGRNRICLHQQASYVFQPSGDAPPAP
jgi:two-component system cell cycle response regulator